MPSIVKLTDLKNIPFKAEYLDKEIRESNLYIIMNFLLLFIGGFYLPIHKKKGGKRANHHFLRKVLNGAIKVSPIMNFSIKFII